jgi:colicin import membrane protein
MSVTAHPILFILSTRSPHTGQRIGSMLILSLVLHALAFMIIVGLRLPAKVERPLSSYEVSLVAWPTPERVETPSITPSQESSPTPQVIRPAPQSVLKKLEALKEKPTPPPVVPKLPAQVRASERVPILKAREPLISAPAPVRPSQSPPGDTSAQKPVPMPSARISSQSTSPPTIKVPEYKPVELATSSARRTLDRDVLRGIALPPEAPRLSDVAPDSAMATSKESPDPTPTQKDIKKLLGNLTVPEPSLPAAAQPQKEKPQPAKLVPVRPSVTAELDELNKKNERLQNEYKQMEYREPPRQVAQARPVTPPPLPQVTRTSLQHPITKISAQSSGPGANRYLQIVQQRIIRQWQPYQVDPMIEAYRVIVKFRLYRNGNVQDQDVVVEETSGNGYFDDAGKRAVLRARPLPAFPDDMPDPYLDAHFSFLVGEQAS